jgi:hypothetical protein
MPSPSRSTGPLRTFARLLGLSAAVLGILLTGVLLMINPYDTGGITAGTVIVGVVMILLALLAGWAAFTVRPVILLLAFIGSFVPVGYYLLGTPGVFALIGVADLGYLVASALMFLDARNHAVGARRRR